MASQIQINNVTEIDCKDVVARKISSGSPQRQRDKFELAYEEEVGYWNTYFIRSIR